jgi:hypothetical protein
MNFALEELRQVDWLVIKIKKEQSEILRFVKLSAENGSSDDCHAIGKAKSKRTEEMELA